MLLTDEQIIEEYKDRRRSREPWLNQATKIQQIFNNEYTVPLPELDEVDAPAVANLINLGVDQMGLRIASTMPGVTFPVLRNSATAREVSRTKRDVVLSWWEDDDFDIYLGQAGRWFAAYAQIVLQIRNEPKSGRPRYVWRDPLCSFPSQWGESAVECDDAVFAYQRTLGWMRRKYPDAAPLDLGPKPKDSDIIDVLEYVSCDEYVLLAKTVDDAANMQTPKFGVGFTRLNWAPNRLERCPVVSAYRLGLSRPVGQMDGTVGSFVQRALLQALEYVGVKAGVFPDTWMLGDGTATPRVIQEADGIRGVTGIVQGAKGVQRFTDQPGYMTNPMLDRLERNERVTGRIPAEFGGEGATNVRTGKRGDQILSATVDVGVQDAQRTFAKTLRRANDLAMAWDRTYYGSTSKTVYVSIGGMRDREATYKPSELWQNTRHTVSYSHAGADVNGLIIGIGQRVGMGTMSKRTGMDLDPMIEDADAEHDMVVAEALEMALLQSVQQRAANGQLPEADVARIMQLVRENDVDLADAIMQAQREAQERQAQQAPPTSPEAMPGMANPGAGAEAMPSVAPPAEGSRNLSQLLATLRLPTMQTPAERSVA